jgi:hypothetical protein
MPDLDSMNSSGSTALVSGLTGLVIPFGDMAIFEPNFSSGRVAYPYSLFKDPDQDPTFPKSLDLDHFNTWIRIRILNPALELQRVAMFAKSTKSIIWSHTVPSHQVDIIGTVPYWYRR